MGCRGGIIFGITGALYGEITIEEGRVVQSNFTDYRMLRINETPPIEVHLVKRRGAGRDRRAGYGHDRRGGGNAIFAATGKRLRKLPVGDQLKTARGGDDHAKPHPEDARHVVARRVCTAGRRPRTPPRRADRQRARRTRRVSRESGRLRRVPHRRARRSPAA